MAASTVFSQAVACLLMLGTGAGIGLSLALSSGRVVPGSFAPMMSLGSGYGTWAALALIKVTNSRPDNYAQPVLGCELVGAGLSLAVANGLAMTGGDAGASSTGAIFGGLVPFLVVGMGANGSSNIDPLIATALVGSTLGMVAAPIINQRLGWSRSRWNLIALGGGVGLLFGGGLAVLVSVNSAAGGFGLAALGTVGGLLLAGYLTDEFSPDEPRRGGSTALLESSPGEGLRFGSLAGAIAPAFTQRGGALLTGLQLRAFEARF